MAITLQALPRETERDMRVISSTTPARPAFGGPVQPMNRKGSRFALDITVPALALAGCGPELIADLVQGETESLAMPVPEAPSSVGWGTPRVNGAGQAGLSLIVDGLPAGRTVPKGKFLSVITGGQRFVYLVRTATTANGSGQVTLPIWPMLRRSPANNDVVELAQPMIEGFIPTGQEWSVRRLKALGASFSIEERE